MVENDPLPLPRKTRIGFEPPDAELLALARASASPGNLASSSSTSG